MDLVRTDDVEDHAVQLLFDVPLDVGDVKIFMHSGKVYSYLFRFLTFIYWITSFMTELSTFLVEAGRLDENGQIENEWKTASIDRNPGQTSFNLTVLDANLLDLGM